MDEMRSEPGLNKTQREWAELLDTIVTMVEQRRHNHSQKFERARRQLNDASSPQARSAAGSAMDFHDALQHRYRSLRDEVTEVICEECGPDWRALLTR